MRHFIHKSIKKRVGYAALQHHDIVLRCESQAKAGMLMVQVGSLRDHRVNNLQELLSARFLERGGGEGGGTPQHPPQDHRNVVMCPSCYCQSSTHHLLHKGVATTSVLPTEVMTVTILHGSLWLL
jgi:hypothetical protein